ncbi:MAG: hypothetical protein H7839_23480, partial [Magnetococcus sp. YQC-5]
MAEHHDTQDQQQAAELLHLTAEDTPSTAHESELVQSEKEEAKGQDDLANLQPGVGGLEVSKNVKQADAVLQTQAKVAVDDMGRGQQVADIDNPDGARQIPVPMPPTEVPTFEPIEFGHDTSEVKVARSEPEVRTQPTAPPDGEYASPRDGDADDDGGGMPGGQGGRETTFPPAINPTLTDPVTAAPTTTEPEGTPVPVTNSPGGAPPATSGPEGTNGPGGGDRPGETTNSPTTESPGTNPPGTNPPTTESPVTTPPVTTPPVTTPPVTTPPVTTPPV